MYKLVGIDMDGTLLRDDKSISEENYNAIQKAKELGVKIVLATGRPLKGIEKYLKQLKLTSEGDYSVAFNGAVVQKNNNGKVISENLLKHEDLKYLYNLSKQLNVNIHILTFDFCAAAKLNKYSKLESSLNKIPLKILDLNQIPDYVPIVKVMFVDEEEKLSKAIENLPRTVYEKYTVLRSEPYFLEFINKNVNKGFGIQVLKEKLNISRDEIMCIGDAGNDIHMIKYAGLGVAMENAFSDTKKVADYITKTNEQNGVAHVINKFILEQCAVK
ncbi:sugar-phosphatase [Clostridium autoethanogenum]|uniref:Sugar-phosphatase n=1 Tax=Clostridium autoethanogenum TaxID=84023 RepID=A0A3M0SPZ9_9CLOT|nr:sugar-phosphatase [Clostridium autoethanogenum]RMD00474.1 sugar-phosphatase [Clostridium autoethanogenum]